jgi:hypothetical protein
MTGVTITFSSNDTINIANASGGTITFDIAKLLTSGIFDTPTQVTINNNINQNYSFGEIGLYKISNHTSGAGVTIIIADDILTELEKDIKEILLSDDIQRILPKGYDFVNLVMLSIMFIGNNTYQNATYSSGNDTLYTNIAEAIARCTKYLDRQVNTFQSTNRIWQ